MNAFRDLIDPALADGDMPPTCNCAWIARWFDHDGSEAIFEDFLEALISQRGFPKPLPHRRHGGTVSDDVHYTRSRWIRAGVVEWLGDYLPPDAHTMLETAAQEDAAEEMDEAALHLRLVACNEEVAA